MEFIVAKRERDLQKVTLAIRCQKYFATIWPKLICTAVELLAEALCRQQFAGCGFGFVATAAGAGTVGVVFLGLAGDGHEQATEFFYQLALNPPIKPRMGPCPTKARVLGACLRHSPFWRASGNALLIRGKK